MSSSYDAYMCRQAKEIRNKYQDQIESMLLARVESMKNADFYPSYELIKLPEINESKPASFLYKVSVFAVSFLAALSIVLLLFYTVIQIKSPT